MFRLFLTSLFSSNLYFKKTSILSVLEYFRVVGNHAERINVGDLNCNMHDGSNHNSSTLMNILDIYYMKESVLLGTKPLVHSIRHFIRDPSGVFSVCHLGECRIVQ